MQRIGYRGHGTNRELRRWSTVWVIAPMVRGLLVVLSEIARQLPPYDGVLDAPGDHNQTFIIGVPVPRTR